MKKLYRVDGSWYVMAEDSDDAVRIKPDWMAIDLEAYPVDRNSGVDIGWWAVMPFNEDNRDTRTCGQIFCEEVK